MKLGRRSSEPVRRQRLRSEDLNAKAPSFAYRSRRSEDNLRTGRKNSKEAGVSVSKPTNFWLQRAGLIVLTIALIFSIANILSLSSQAKILPMISGQDKTFLRDETEYETAASKILAGSVWNKNKITVDSAKLGRDLQKQFPELSNVSVTIPMLSHRPLVYIQPAEPALIIMARNGSFLVSDSGKALVQADSPEALNQPDLPKLSDQSGLRVELGKQALPTDDVVFIRMVAAQLAAKQLKIESMTLPPAARELGVKVAGQAYTVKFNLMAGKARQQAGAYIATMEDLKTKNITPSQYIDVRVVGRAYYK